MPFSSGTRTKFCLKLGHQDFVLPHGIVVLGRDPACLITFLDSLMSRKHARIRCDGEHAVIEDLESRNGTRINGILISGPHSLRDGDRIGIGSSELVFTLAEDDRRLASAATGLMSVCPVCRQASSDAVCAHCGAARTETNTARARVEETAQSRWSLGMLIEMLGKAMLTERVLDADRLMHEAAMLVDEQLRGSAELDPEELHVLHEVAKWLSKAQLDDTWLGWVATVQGRSHQTVSPPPAP